MYSSHSPPPGRTSTSDTSGLSAGGVQCPVVEMSDRLFSVEYLHRVHIAWIPFRCRSGDDAMLLHEPPHQGRALRPQPRRHAPNCGSYMYPLVYMREGMDVHMMTRHPIPADRGCGAHDDLADDIPTDRHMYLENLSVMEAVRNGGLHRATPSRQTHSPHLPRPAGPHIAPAIWPHALPPPPSPAQPPVANKITGERQAGHCAQWTPSPNVSV